MKQFIVPVLVTLASLSNAAPTLGYPGAANPFVARVLASKPIAYYRLETPSGKSEVGKTTYKAIGGVSAAKPGAPIGVDGNAFAQFDGVSGQIVTSQVGGIRNAASIMAWVNLDQLPGTANRIMYVAGESEYGNDLDLQFEKDNALRFFTAAAPHVSYSPDTTTLLHQWHMIVAVLDTTSGKRQLYWDGKLAASDSGGGIADKKNPFTIGASTIFKGRWFAGGIDEVALWNRALTANEIANIYAAATPATSSP